MGIGPAGKRYTMTEKALRARREALKKIKRQGRPPSSLKPRDVLQTRRPLRERTTRTYAPGTVEGEWLRAKLQCKELTPKAVEFWRQVMAGQIRGSTVGDRLRAAENIANRGGLPVQSSLEITEAIPPKLLEPGFRDAQGVQHDVEITGPPETAQ